PGRGRVGADHRAVEEHGPDRLQGRPGQPLEQRPPVAGRLPAAEAVVHGAPGAEPGGQVAPGQARNSTASTNSPSDSFGGAPAGCLTSASTAAIRPQAASLSSRRVSSMTGGPGGAVASYDRAPLQSPTANSSTRPSPKAIAPASCRQRRQERPGRPQNDLG